MKWLRQKHITNQGSMMIHGEYMGQAEVVPVEFSTLATGSEWVMDMGQRDARAV